ncbi:MAG TPA: hypothetical protein VEB42_01495 [Chitinophagaceae bacterium]|nr:hypothetical protein [Chitinophagaceae bacterium]
MPEYRIVPFTAQITRGTSSSEVAKQMQYIIDQNLTEGFHYMHMDSVETSVAGSEGCFGIGAQPAFTTFYHVMVFKK